MRKALLSLVLLAGVGLIMGCGDYGSIVVCYDNQDTWCQEVGARMGEDLVCNMAVTVQEECERLMAMIPDWLPVWVRDWITIPDVCSHIPDMGYLGTCQDGSPGLDCAEQADCLGECVLGDPPAEEGICGDIPLA